MRAVFDYIELFYNYRRISFRKRLSAAALITEP